MKKLIAFLALSTFTLVALGCPPDGAKKDEHKPGDGHDHDKDKEKK